MPFVSERQRRYLYSQKPDVAHKFETHNGKKLHELGSVAKAMSTDEKRNTALGAAGVGAVGLAPVRRRGPSAAHRTVHGRLAAGGSHLTPEEYRAIAQGTGFRAQNTRYTAGLAGAVASGKVPDSPLRVKVYDDRVVPSDGAHRASANSMLGRPTKVEVERVKGRAPTHTTLVGRVLEDRNRRGAQRSLKRYENIGTKGAGKLYRNANPVAMGLNRFWSGSGRGTGLKGLARNPLTTAAAGTAAAGGGLYAARERFGKDDNYQVSDGGTPLAMARSSAHRLPRGRLIATALGGGTVYGQGQRRKVQERNQRR